MSSVIGQRRSVHGEKGHAKAICVTNDSTVRLPAQTRAPLLSKNGALSLLEEMKLPKPISWGKILQRRSDRGQKEKIGNPTAESEWTELLSFQVVYLVPAEVQPALTSLALSMRLSIQCGTKVQYVHETRALWGGGSWESTGRLPPTPWVESDEPRLPDRQQQSRRHLH